jgi:FKBP-type peptidyl-prolyl cis-trans isomerase
MYDESSGHSMKPGVELLEDVPGGGAPVERKVFYDFRLRMWLSRGDPIRWSETWGLYDRARIEDDGTTLFTSLRVDRVHMFAGLFYGVEGMRVGGTRRIRVAPHLAYGEAGLPVVPANALLTVEIHVLAERGVADRPDADNSRRPD